MKISRNQLRKIISETLTETEKTDPKGKPVDAEKTEKSIDAQMRKFGFDDLEQKKKEDEDAIEKFRKPKFPDPDSFGTQQFGTGTEKGRTGFVGGFPEEPSADDRKAVDSYREKLFLSDKPGEASAYDDRYTNPYGFMPRQKEKSSAADPDVELYSDDAPYTPNVETFEDEDGNERTYIDGVEVTPSVTGHDKPGFLEKVRKFFGGK